jgi:hypothetical protein
MIKDLYCIVLEDCGYFDLAVTDDGIVFMSKEEAEAELLLYNGPILSTFNPKLAKLTFIEETK